MAKKDKPIDKPELVAAWKKERVAILERNAHNADVYEGRIAELRRRWEKRRTLVVCCMDERNAFLEEALGLLPGEATVMASNGGHFQPYELKDACSPNIKSWIDSKFKVTICLVAHTCSGHPELGCSAFENDMAAQVSYFNERKQELVSLYPEAFVSVLMLDTSSNRLMPVDLEESDDHLADLLAEQVNRDKWQPGRLDNAGYGVYAGDGYLAWIDGENKYARLSACHSALATDLLTAVRLIRDREVIDLTKQPIIVHLDYPIYEDATHTGRTRRHLDKQAEIFLADPEVKELRDNEQLHIMRTELEMVTRRGMDIS